MQQVKGAVLKSRLAFVRQHAGADGEQRLLASLSADDQAVLTRLLTVKWYPFDLGTRLDDAIVRVIGGGDPAFFERLGAASADANLTTIHSMFIVQGDPHAFLGKAATIYALYYEAGRRDYVRTGQREGLLTTRDADTFSKPDCLTVIGWYRRALEMCGARDVRIVEEECRAAGGAVCRYRVAWS